MALVNPYCTVAEVQAELRNTDPLLVAQLETCVNAASRWVDEYKGRDYYQHDHLTTALDIRKVHGHVTGATLWLPYRPIIQITEVKVQTELWTSGTDYLAVTEGRLVCLSGDWPIGDADGEQTLIKGKFGYAQTATTAVPTGIPDHIRMATILVAAALSGHNQKEIIGLDGTREQVVDKAIPASVEKLLGSKHIGRA